MVTPLFVSDPPSDGTSNWMKSFSYWFPAKSFTVFALDGNEPQVCSRSQPARIGVVSVLYEFSWILGVVPGVVFNVVQKKFEPDLDISDIDESEYFTWSKRRFTFNMRCGTVSLEPWRWWLGGGDGVALVQILTVPIMTHLLWLSLKSVIIHNYQKAFDKSSEWNWKCAARSSKVRIFSAFIIKKKRGFTLFPSIIR